MAIEAWFMEDNDEDQRLLHHSNPKEFVSPDHLTLDPKIYENDKELQKTRQERGYNYMDLLDLCHANMENYEQQLRNFYIELEHIHVDEEIRYCLEERGYFDVWDKEYRWIQIWIKPGSGIRRKIISNNDMFPEWTGHVRRLRACELEEGGSL
ncbi:Ard4p [Orobanche minor]